MVENWTACAIRRFWKSNGRSKIHHLETSQEKWHCLEFWKILDWQKWQSYQKIQQELSNCPYFQRHFKLGLIFDPSFFKGSYVNMWLEYYHISMIWLFFFTKFIRIEPVHHMFSQITQFWNPNFQINWEFVKPCGKQLAYSNCTSKFSLFLFRFSNPC